MSRYHPSAAAALEGRLAARLAEALTQAQAPLPADIAERLRFARQQALAKAGSVRRPLRAQVTAPQWVAVTAGMPAGWGAPQPWWQRAASVLPLLMLVVGLVGIDQWTQHEQVLEIAAIDTALLSDDLPPEAYADPGFAEFLHNEPSP